MNLIEGLKDYDVEPFVILQEPGDLAGLLERAGVKVAYAPVRWWTHTRGRIKSALSPLLGEKYFIKDEWKDYDNIARIVEILKAWDINLVQSNSSVIPAGYYASRALNIPHIWHLREFLDNYGFHFDLGNIHTKQIINSSEACIAISNAVAECYFDPVAPGIKKVIYNGVMSHSGFNALHEKHLASKQSGNNFTFGLIGKIGRAHV